MFEVIKQSSIAFGELLQKELSSKVKLVVRSTPDALVAAALLSKVLSKKQVNFALSFFQETSAALDEVCADSSQLIIFIGFGEYDLIVSRLRKQFFMINNKAIPDVLPNVLAIPDVYISSVVYLMIKSWGEQGKDYSTLAMLPFAYVGKKPFEELLDDFSALCEIRTVSCLAVSSTQPIHKVLEFSSDPFLPGISGSEDGCFSFLRECSVSLKENGRFRLWSDLSDEETRLVLSNISLRARLFQQSSRLAYFLKSEPADSSVKDVFGLYVLVDACLSAGQPSLALSVCLYPGKFRQRAMEVFVSTKRSLIAALQMWYISAYSGNLLGKENLLFVNVASQLRENLVFPFVSTAIKHYPESKVVFFLVSGEEKMRLIVGSSNQYVDLRPLGLKLAALGYSNSLEGGFLVAEVMIGEEKKLLEGISSLGEGLFSEEIVR